MFDVKASSHVYTENYLYYICCGDTLGKYYIYCRRAIEYEWCYGKVESINNDDLIVLTPLFLNILTL